MTNGRTSRSDASGEHTDMPGIKVDLSTAICAKIYHNISKEKGSPNSRGADARQFPDKLNGFGKPTNMLKRYRIILCVEMDMTTPASMQKSVCTRSHLQYQSEHSSCVDKSNGRRSNTET